MSNEDIIHSGMNDLSVGIAMRSKMSQNQAYSILIKIGFYEERYGPMPIKLKQEIIKIIPQSDFPEASANSKEFIDERIKEMALGAEGSFFE